MSSTTCRTRAVTHWLRRGRFLTGLVALVGAGGLVWQLLPDSPIEGGSSENHSREYREYIESTHQAVGYRGEPFPKFATTDIDGNEVSSDLEGMSGGLFLVFDPRTCLPCLTTQLKVFRHIRSLSDAASLSILAVGRSHPEILRRYSRAFSLNFPIVSDPNDVLLPKALKEYGLGVYLVDTANNVLEAHFPRKGLPQLSGLFYYEIQDHLALNAPLYDGLLAGEDHLAVIRGDFNSGPLSELWY